MPSTKLPSLKGKTIEEVIVWTNEDGSINVEIETTDKKCVYVRTTANPRVCVGLLETQSGEEIFEHEFEGEKN
jgi:hypothetical protein